MRQGPFPATFTASIAGNILATGGAVAFAEQLPQMFVDILGVLKGPAVWGFLGATQATPCCSSNPCD